MFGRGRKNKKAIAAKEENPQHRSKADTRTKNAKSKFVPKKWPVSGVFA
jgi:hypothetical protein